ncbi:DUF3857 domain-containing protein [Flammeovirga pectinis]|uniref:DUF3857 domain-containing protein n=1 Tax=Flammeovirga pectinis TaxID=2494373 RepID=A0A3Q9FJF4_9BACT|nr:DUF3857 and transglutaminase domain-containing protein [Flammeovirga pectinis]AZQ61478.1 DUF3857 domain-containing protein [Flammeovirga pectinis]
MTININNFLQLIWCFLLFSTASFADNAVVQKYNKHIEIHKNKKIETVNVVLKINAVDADHYGDIAIHFNSLEKLSILEAYVLDANGNKVRTIKKDDISEISSISNGVFYEDSKQKKFKLSWYTYPYAIHYKYKKVSSEFITIANWVPFLYTGIKTLDASLEVDFPKDYEVSIITPEIYDLEESGETARIYKKWHLKNNIKYNIKSQRFSKPIFDIIKPVNIVPTYFKYGVSGSNTSWKAFGDWIYTLNAGLYQLPLSEKQYIHNLVDTITDKKEKVRKLYHYLQDETRYINVSFDVGGFKSYPAEYVVKNKYGDCKALTTYMKALLDEISIPSFPTVVYAGDVPRSVNSSFPSQQFNHIILCVDIDSDTLFLENTSSISPFNSVSSFTQNRKALLLDNSKSHLIDLPPLTLADVEEIKTINISLNEQLENTIQSTLVMKGPEFDFLRYISSKKTEKNQKEYLREFYTINQKAEFENYTFLLENRDSTSIKLELKYTLKKSHRKIGDMFVFTPKPLYDFKIEKPSDRLHDVYIPTPVNKIEKITYKFAVLDDSKISVSKPISIKTKYGEYIENYMFNDKEVTLQRNFKLYSQSVPLKEYEEFYTFFNDVKTKTKQSSFILQQTKTIH